MDIQTTKTYRPSSKIMLLRLLIVIAVIVGISFAIPYHTLPGLAAIPVILTVFFVVKMMSDGTEVIAVASTKVELGKFLGKQIILMRSIQYIRSVSHFGLHYIVIETDKDSFRMGGFLSAQQKKEVVTNIMEHIRVNIPENFFYVKRKVDKF
jgi:hypothetical protein